MKDFDTIAAVATGYVESGISLIRVSGSEALSVVNNIFKDNKNRELNSIKPYTMRYGHIVNKNTNEIIDEVIVSFMKAPKSYTAEDTIEINCHGGILATRKILEMVIQNGARLAEKGEFTKRAFLNGRIDLSQAESVMDIINAKTEYSMKAAVSLSQGKLKNRIALVKDDLLDAASNIEATVDFPEEDIDESINEDIINKVNKAIEYIDNLLKTADEGKILREGLSIALVGKPNVGKSSIMNAILEENRSIVTDIPGTTRDVIEELINMDGIPVRLYDTAGIHDTEDVVEKIGVERSKKSLEEADLVVLTIDNSRDLSDEDRKLLDIIQNKKFVIAINKSDLTSKPDMDFIKSNYDKQVIEVSAKTGFGLDKFKQYIKDSFFNGDISINELYVSNSRQKEALLNARKYLMDALKTLESGFEIDMASMDIKEALNSLGELTGDTVTEDILNRIFSKFCVGK